MITLPFGPNPQRLQISTSMGSTKVQWPGIPEEHAMPFKNVEYLDDLFTWAEAEGLLDERPTIRMKLEPAAWDTDLDDRRGDG